MKARSFSQRYPPNHPGPRYGPLFRRVRDMECWLVPYQGPGHRGCGRGVQGDHTAHHVGRTDREGLLPVCGRAHDLAAGLGGRETIRHYRAWLKSENLNPRTVALGYVLAETMRYTQCSYSTSLP